TQNLSTIEQLVYLGNVVELNQIEQTDTHIKLGSAVTYSNFTELLGEQYPDLAQMIERIGSTQIRNTGTLGGNIGNASPIGDMPPAMIALNATMTLRKGKKTREIAVEDYFKDYKVTDLKKSEFIQDISIPKAQDGQHFKVYKVSKRIDDDISAVLASILIEIDGKKVKSVSIAFGGMAAIPKRATACEKALLNKPWTQTNVDKAKKALAKDFQPMSDVRASDAYRMKVAQNLLQKCFIELQNRTIETRVANYA
ncbi:MAG: FAD binding domain-containing protein, partial [Psychrosphaera sp.]|nr:FAD binding domain-containing protein [Psychrosphaera sp.]